MELEGICDDSSFEEIINGDYTTKRMYTKVRMDGSTYVNLESGCAWTAEELIGSMDEHLDSKIAYGLTYILLNSTIIFGKVGEQFCKDKLNGFSQEKYSLFIAEKMLNHYGNMKRKQAIIQGVIDAINDKNNVYANAVKAAILSLEYFAMKEYEMSDDIEDRFFSDSIIPYEEVYTLLTYKEYGEFNKEEIMTQLDYVYNYLLEHDDIIFSGFKNYFSNLIKNELIIYYIANGDIKEINYIIHQIEK